MGRPLLADRDLVKDVVMTLKLSGAERARLDRLVEARAVEIHKLTGQRIDLSVAAYLRWLLDRDGEARGIPLEESDSEPPPVRPHVAIVKPACEVEANADSVRAAVRSAMKAGRSQGSIAKAAKVDAGAFSRFLNKGEGLGADKLRAIAKALR